MSHTALSANGTQPMATRLGLRANWQQFWLLVLVNAFVGAMVGLERTVLPLLAEREFGLVSTSAALSFIATFGLVKAATNYFAGRFGDRFGRKNILVAGWLFGVPVPFLVIWAPTWSWIIAANVLLGVNQGLAWSTTVVMKIDLVGPKRRGLAMGLNEFAGYLAVALSALVSGEIAARYGLRPEPFYLGIGFVALGLMLSQVFVRDTSAHVRAERSHEREAGTDSVPNGNALVRGRDVFLRVSWRDPALFNACQAGLVNNLNDGVAWGLLPLFFRAAGLNIREIGVLAFAYPASWGIAQLWTGALSDRIGRKWLVASGMVVQGVALLGIVFARGFDAYLATQIILGIGTAMVYPTLLAVIGDVAAPGWRGSAVGIYRLWRDMGYVVGALGAGAVADFFGMSPAIVVVGAITLASGSLAALRMPESMSRR